MANNSIELVVTLENGQFKVAAKDTEAAITKMGGAATGAGTAGATGFKKFFNSLTTVQGAMKGFLALAVVQKLYEIGKAALQGAAEMEKNKAAFEVMTGSAKKATAILKDLKEYGAKTPFELPGLVDSARMMMSFGIATEEVMPNLKMLGDVAGGDQEKLSSLTLAFSQMSSTGRLMGQDLLQMVNAGFNPLQVISEATGESMGSLKQKMENGAISAQAVTEAFKLATSEGGRFHGMTEKMGKTLAGRLSTMKDNFNQLLTAMGEEAGPAMGQVVDGLISISDAGGIVMTVFKAVGKVWLGLVNIGLTFVQGLKSIVTGIQVAYYEVKKVTKGLSDADNLKLTNLKKEFVDGGVKIKEIWMGVDTTVQDIGKSASKSKQDVTALNKALGAGGGKEKGGGSAAKKTTDTPGMNVGGGGAITSAAAAIQQGNAAIEAAQAAHTGNMTQMYAAQAANYSAMGTAIVNKGMEVARALMDLENQTAEQQMNSLDARYAWANLYLEKTEKDEKVRAEKKKKLDLMQAIAKYHLERKQFENNKSVQYALTSVNMASGIVGAIALGIAQLGPIAGAIVGAIEAAAIAAVGGIQLSTIARSKPPMFVPSYDSGIFDVPRDTPASIHAGESVLTRPITESLKNNEITISGPGGGARVIQLVVDGKTLASVVDNERNKTASSMNARNYSTGSVY